MSQRDFNIFSDNRLMKVNISDKTLALRITLTILWFVIFVISAAAWHNQIKTVWLYLGVGLAFVVYWLCFWRRNSPLICKILLYLLPLFLLVGIAGNIYLSKKFVEEHFIYELKKGDRLSYWFDRYAERNAKPVDDAQFYLALRRILAGSSIVSAGDNPLREYDLINMAHLEKMSVENYDDSPWVALKAMQLLTNHPGLQDEAIRIVQISASHGGTVWQPVPFVVFSWKDGREDTYYLYHFKLATQGDGVVPGYLLVPREVHLALSSPVSNRTTP